MPEGTHVHRVYDAIMKKSMATGMSEKRAKAKAARISQAVTGKSLATGKAPKHGH